MKHYTKKDRKLLVFFSVDVSGSTAYKLDNSDFQDYDKHWARFYENFFTDFHNKFLGEIDKIQERFGVEISMPTLWKILGDEILFHWKVKDKPTLLYVCLAFFHAFRKYDSSIAEKYNLRLKAMAWVAGFPIRNSEIKLRAVDFIGPDIDLGFRLGAHTQPGRMVASMDLVDLLAQCQAEDNFDVHHVGWARLKGVFNANPYPIYWLEDGPPKRAVP